MLKVSLLVLLMSGLVHCEPVPKPTLKGVTVVNPPYIELIRQSPGFYGFLVDLMQKIAEKSDFNFQLYLSPDGKYGVIDQNGTTNGMLYELVQKKADFALADLTITDRRKEVVNFTEPFMVTQLGAVLKKDYALEAKTLSELVYRNNLKAKSERLPYAVLRNGSTYHHLSTTKDAVAKSIFKSLAESDSYLSSYKEGIEKVKSGARLAVLMEISSAQYAALQDCSLVVLPDDREVSRREYAIALPIGSPYLAKFNQAIAELKGDGTIEKLKQRHWSGQCQTPTQA